MNCNFFNRSSPQCVLLTTSKRIMKTWHKIAIITVIIVGILISVKSCVDKRDADITLAYIGSEFIDCELFNENVKALHSVCSDINADGELVVDIMEISFNDSLSQADKQNSDSKLANAVGAGAARVYLIEEKYLMNNASSGVFADLSHLGDGFKNASGEVCGISVKGNTKVEKLGIDASGDIYLAVRIVSEIDALTDKNIEKKHALAMDIAEYILKD